MGSFVKSYGLTMLVTCSIASVILVLWQFAPLMLQYSGKSALFMPAASFFVTTFTYIFFLNYIILFVIIVPIYAVIKKFVTINWWSAIIIGLCVCSLNGFIIYLLMTELFSLMFALRLILLHGVLFGVILKLIHEYALSPSGIKWLKISNFTKAYWFALSSPLIFINVLVWGYILTTEKLPLKGWAIFGGLVIFDASEIFFFLNFFIYLVIYWAFYRIFCKYYRFGFLASCSVGVVIGLINCLAYTSRFGAFDNSFAIWRIFICGGFIFGIVLYIVYLWLLRSNPDKIVDAVNLKP